MIYPRSIVTVAVLAACGARATEPGVRPSSASVGASAAASTPEVAVCGPPLPASSAATGAQVIQSAHGATVTDHALSASGYLATTSQFDKTIRIWDLPKRRLLAVLQERTFTGFHWDDVEHVLVLEGLGDRSVLKDTGGFAQADLLVRPDGSVAGSRPGELAAVPVIRGGKSHSNALRQVDQQLELRLPGSPPKRLVPPSSTWLSSVGGLAMIVRDGAELVVLGGSHVTWYPLGGGAPTVKQLDGDVEDVDVAADGRVLSARQTDDSVLVELHSRAGAPKPILELDLGRDPDVAIAPDGTIGIVAMREGVIAHDLSSGKAIWSEHGDTYDSTRDRGPVAGFSSVAIARDGATAILARDDGTIALRDVRTGRPLGDLGNVVMQLENVAWVDGRHVMAATAGHVAIWDIVNGELVRSYTEPRGFLAATVVGGDVVVARMTLCMKRGSYDVKTIAWVDRWTGIEPPPALVEGKVPELRDGCTTAGPIAWPPARGAAKSPLALGGAGAGFDLASGRSLTSVPNKFSVDGVLAADGVTTKLDRPLKSMMSKDVLVRGAFVFVPASKGVGVWSAADGLFKHQLGVAAPRWDGALEQVGGLLGVSADSARVAVGRGNRLAVFDTATAKPLVEALLPNPVIATTVAFGATPDRAWVGTLKGEIFELAGGQVRSLGSATAASIEELAPAPDGRKLVAVAGDGGLRVLDSSGALAVTLVEFGDEEPIAFTPGGAYGGTAEAASRIGWRFAAPLEIFGFEQFARAFHRPDIVKRRLAGASDDVATALVRPPTIELAAAPPAVATATVKLDVKASSSRRVDVIRAYREGREVASAKVCASSGAAALEIPLLDGTNTIAVQAFDDLGFASNAALATVARRGGPQPALHVIAIGVGSYPALEPRFQLPLATADANGIASAFRADVGAGKRFAAIHSKILLDKQATVPAVLAALDGLAEMRPDDLAIVAFAGHGMKPAPAEDMVLVTGSVATLAPAELERSGISWTAIGERLARAKGRVIVLLDACHSGHISQNLVVPNDQLAAALSRGGRAGAIVFAAAKGRQSSFEPGGVRGFAVAQPAMPLVGNGDHGYFTGALLASLRDRAADRNGDGVLQMSEWIHATTERVTRATEGLQTPWVARQEMFGDFAIVPVK